MRNPLPRSRRLAALLVAFVTLAAGCPTLPLRSPINVALVGCGAGSVGDMYRGWFVSQLATLRAGLGLDLRPVPESQPHSFEWRCTEIRDVTAAARYTPGTNYVEIDLTRTPGEFAFRGAGGHESFHWFVSQFSPYPDRARFHVCRYAREVPLCYAGTTDRAAMMVPSQGFEDNTDPNMHVYVGTLVQYEPQWSDQRFFSWAMGESQE